MQFLDEILNIIFPKLCCACEQTLTKNEELLCFHCRSMLPKTNLDKLSSNEIVNRMYGKLNIDNGWAYLFFKKAGITQKLLHQLKYADMPELAELLGEWFSYDLLEKGITGKADIIIPIPLHAKREKARGYNQSLYIAKGISKVTKIPIEDKAIKRLHFEESQTHKSKEQRLAGVTDSFHVTDKQRIEQKRILLVDDIITTGATLEACGKQLLKNGAKSISIATLAMAK